MNTMLALYLAQYVARRAPSLAARPLVVLILAVAEWSAGYGLELAGADLPTKLFWAKVEYLGIVTVAPAWFLFAVHYSARKQWFAHAPTYLALLAVVPLVTLLLVWTNEHHGLIWQQTGLHTAGPALTLAVTYGPWFWVHWAYAYLLLLLSSAWLAVVLFRSLRRYRWQIGAIWLGILAPWVANLLYVTKLSPAPGLDLTPFAFGLAGLAFAWSLFRFQLLELVPIARQAVVDGLQDSVILLDLQRRIVNVNPAAQQLLGLPGAQLIGRPIEAVWSDYVHIFEAGGDSAIQSEITFGEGPAQQYFDLQVSPLTGRLQERIGWLVVLHNINRRKQAEALLRRQNEYLAALHETTLGLLQRLEPTSLLETIVTRAASLIGASHGYLYLVNPAETDMVLQVGTGIFSNYLGFKVKRGEGLGGRVWQTGELLTLADYAGWTNHIPALGMIRAVVGIPLRVDRKVVGVIGLAYLESGRTFTPEQIDLLARFGELASLALEHARLYAAVQAELNERKWTEARLQQAKAELEAKVTLRTGALIEANKALQHELLERQRAEERYRTLFEEAPVMYVITRNQAGVPIVADCNRMFLTTLGYSRAEVLEQPLANFYTVSARAELLAGGYQEALEDPFLRAKEHQLIARDGRVVETLLQATPEMDANGQIFGTRAMYIDITLRTQMEEALRENEVKYRSLVENSADGIVMVDESGAIIEWNRGQEHITGLSRFEAVGGYIWDVQYMLTPDHGQTSINYDELKQMILSFLRTGQGLPAGTSVESDIQLADGSQKTIESLIFRINSPTGYRLGSIIRDISERKRAEQALQQERTLLAQRVAERTAELSTANQELGRALRARDEFVANMSHELRTPLSIVALLSGNLDTLYKNMGDADRQQMIRDIRRHTRILNELIGNVLEISRVDSGSISTEQQPLNLAQLVRQEVDKQSSLAKQKAQVLAVQSPGELAVSGNDIQLRQIIRNLVNNAIKYTPPERQITCECLALSRPLPHGETDWPGSAGLPAGRWVAVRVVDTGPGIDEADLPHLFERFYRVKNQSYIPGTGLGLAICQELVKLHAGHIAVASKPGQGSIFAIYLPLREEAEV